MREISHLAFGLGIILFGKEPHIIAQREQPLEQGAGLVIATLQHIIVDQPETAGEERAFARWKSVRIVSCVIAQNETIMQELAFDSGNRSQNPRIGGGQKAHQRNQEQGGVER